MWSSACGLQLVLARRVAGWLGTLCCGLPCHVALRGGVSARWRCGVPRTRSRAPGRRGLDPCRCRGDAATEERRVARQMCAAGPPLLSGTKPALGVPGCTLTQRDCDLVKRCGQTRDPRRHCDKAARDRRLRQSSAADALALGWEQPRAAPADPRAPPLRQRPNFPVNRYVLDFVRPAAAASRPTMTMGDKREDIDFMEILRTKFYRDVAVAQVRGGAAPSPSRGGTRSRGAVVLARHERNALDLV